MKQSKQKIGAVLGLSLALLMGSARAEEEAGAEADQKVRLEALEEAIEGLNRKVEDFDKAFIEGFVNLRYDDERNPNQAATGETGAATDNNGQSGIYARRAEFKFSGNLSPTVAYSLGYDFSENKHKDLGIEIKDLPFLPFVDLGGFNWSLRVGQYRMPFGIMPQTSSSAIWFPERPIIFGARFNNNSQVGAMATALVGERIMGLQVRQKAKLGTVLAYDLQGGYFNNMTQDQAAGANRLQTGFSLQDNDQDFSPAGRLALELSALQTLMEGFLGKNKWQVGASYYKDSTNANFQAQQNSGISHTEAQGYEVLVELWNKMLMIQGEWVKRITGINAAIGATNTNTKEGWYGDIAFDLLPLIQAEVEKGDSLSLIARLESQDNYSNTLGHTTSPTRLGGALKWSYLGGKNHTSLSYFVSAPDMMFGGDYRAAADGGTNFKSVETTVILQQQWAFETGKPK